MEYTWLDLGLYLIEYSFLGWLFEAAYYAVAKRQFYNRGILTLPLLLSYGVTFDLLIVALPPLSGHPVLQYILTLTVVSVVEAVSNHLLHRAGPKLHWGAERSRLFTGNGRGVLASAAVGALYYLVYLVLHPLLLGLGVVTPVLAKRVIVIAGLVLIAADLVSVLFAIRRGGGEGYRLRQEAGRQSRLSRRLTEAIWKRLYKAYPGIHAVGGEEQTTYVFAEGICFDKLIWVFFISALLGDIIETFYCGLVDGEWMNRSSVLYGPFSFVWGLGAVLLTVSLQRLAGMSDRYVFLGGFVIGGAYEYMCSVFTELVFGTVFWDYSDMPLNIGGRTNVLFCFFWGVLALVWIKMIYPPMSKGIERLPAVAGKAITWVAVFFMACNAVLTCGAMLRYHTRDVRPEPADAFEEFLDSQYGDEFMERRWPNMTVTSGGE